MPERLLVVVSPEFELDIAPLRDFLWGLATPSTQTSQFHLPTVTNMSAYISVPNVFHLGENEQDG